MEQTFDWFSAHGLAMRKSGFEREYSCQTDAGGVEVAMLSAGEIPRELAAGRIDYGVTGTDLLREALADWESQVQEVVGLGFGHADLVVAVPSCWIDVETIDDLDAASTAFRSIHGHRLRIATKYHRLVRDFLTARGIADYRLVDSQGATEASVRNLAAEAIADICSTGETLRANHLKALSDGLILRSQATLYRSLRARCDKLGEMLTGTPLR